MQRASAWRIICGAIAIGMTGCISSTTVEVQEGYETSSQGRIRNEYGTVFGGEDTIFQRGTLIFFGLLFCVLMYALIRSRAVAYPDKLVVVNGYRRREFEWPQVIAARLPPGAPWVTLDLADGEAEDVMGIQGSDGDRARTALRELKALVAAASA